MIDKQIVIICKLLCYFSNAYADDRAALYIAVVDKVFHDCACLINRDCESEPLGIVGNKLNAVDSDNLAVLIDECAAAVSGADCRVRLNKIQ